MASQYDIPWHMLKGLDPDNSEFCTLKGSVSTGLEPSARDEIAVKLRSVAFCARGRVFFDVKIEQVPEALKLRSLDHINVLIIVEPKFGFVKNKVLCLRRLRLLPRQLDWHKALSVWQRRSGFQGEPHTRRPDDQLEVIELTVEAPGPAGDGDGPAPAAAPAAAPNTVRDLLDSLRQPVKGTRPEEVAVKDTGGTEPPAEPQQDTEATKVAEAAEPAAGDGKTASDGAGAGEAQTAEVTGGSAGGDVITAGQTVETDAAQEATSDAAVDAAQSAAEPAQTEAADTQETADADTQAEKTDSTPEETGEAEAKVTDSAAGEVEAKVTDSAGGEAKAEATDGTPGKAEDSIADKTPERPQNTADMAPEKTEGEGDAPSGAPSGAPATVDQVAPPTAGGSAGEGVVSFRATCFRAGGGKQGHAFSSNEGAENFGGAVQNLFGWKVRMKGYDLEVVLDVEFDMVSVGLSLTPRALFNRNLVKLGPTSLRSTICYNLLMMAKPQPYEVVVDPMCGGGSISLEGVQAFPGSFHLCGDNYPDAAARVALNREYSARQCSDTAQLAMDIFTWDCTRLPLRDAVADVIVSDLPFGKRMGSKFDNRTLYPACMEEMARICVPRYGRAVLLTQDKRTMERTLHGGRIKNLWRCRGSPYVNIGGLDGCAYFLQRTDYVRRAPRPPPPAGARGPAPGPARPPGPTDVSGPPAEAAGAPAAAAAAAVVDVSVAEKSREAADVAAESGSDGKVAAVAESAAAVPEPTAPAAAASEASGPEASVPDATVPEGAVPEAGVREDAVPEAAAPDAKILDTAVAEAAAPGAVVPDVPVSEPDATHSGAVSGAAVPDTAASESSSPDASAAELAAGDAAVTPAAADVTAVRVGSGGEGAAQSPE